jgi:hypothetical protein
MLGSDPGAMVGGCVLPRRASTDCVRRKEEIDAFLENLRTAWYSAPSLRFGQLTHNLYKLVDPGVSGDAYYETDANFALALLRMAARNG